MSRESRLRNKAVIDIQSSKERIIGVSNEQGMFNSKCFLNAVNYAIKNSCSVVEVVVIRDGWTTLHYINKADSGYLETTLGFECEYYEYYFLRVIPEEDYKNIDWIFDNVITVLSRPYINWFDRHILRISRVF